MEQIDEMDLHYYIEVLKYKKEKEYWKNVDEVASMPV